MPNGELSRPSRSKRSRLPVKCQTGGCRASDSAGARSFEWGGAARKSHQSNRTDLGRAAAGRRASTSSRRSRSCRDTRRRNDFQLQESQSTNANLIRAPRPLEKSDGAAAKPPQVFPLTPSSEGVIRAPKSFSMTQMPRFFDSAQAPGADIEPQRAGAGFRSCIVCRY